jgi:hypothetical protein
MRLSTLWTTHWYTVVVIDKELILHDGGWTIRRYHRILRESDVSIQILRKQGRSMQLPLPTTSCFVVCRLRRQSSYRMKIGSHLLLLHHELATTAVVETRTDS